MKSHKCQLFNTLLLDAVNPRDKLKGRAGWRVTLDVRLRSTVHCVEHDKTVLCPSILKGQNKEEDIHISDLICFPSNYRVIRWKDCKSKHQRKTLTSPPKSVSAGGPPLKYLWLKKKKTRKKRKKGVFRHDIIETKVRTAKDESTGDLTQ